MMIFGWLLSAWRGGGLVKYAEMAGLAVLIFLGGVAVGNVRATRSFVADVQKHDDEAFASATNQIAEQVKAKTAQLQNHLNEDAVRGRSADDHATATLTAAVKDAGHARDMALSQLTKERAARPMEIPNASCPPIEPFSFGPDSRRLLDAVSGAITPAAAPARARGPDTETAGAAP